MSFLTSMALRRPTAALLAIFLVLGSGIFAYRTLQVELFPQIEFPLVTVFAAYPSADPGAVVQHVTEPIERAIAGTSGLESIQSTSFEGNTAVFATFKYGTDMAEAESAINTAVNGIAFSAGVEEPNVGRFNPDQFPVIQFSVVSDRDVAEIQGIVQSRILPEVSEIDGVMQVALTGEVERSIRVSADADKLASTGVSLFQISAALSENNLTSARRRGLRRYAGSHRQNNPLIRLGPGHKRSSRRRIRVRTDPPIRRGRRNPGRRSTQEHFPHQRQARHRCRDYQEARCQHARRDHRS